MTTSEVRSEQYVPLGKSRVENNIITRSVYVSFHLPLPLLEENQAAVKLASNSPILSIAILHFSSNADPETQHEITPQHKALSRREIDLTLSLPQSVREFDIHSVTDCQVATANQIGGRVSPALSRHPGSVTWLLANLGKIPGLFLDAA